MDALSVEPSVLSSAVVETVQAALQALLALENVARCSDRVVAELLGDAAPDELRISVAQLRGAALHAASLAIELGAAAGRLDALATVRQCAE